MAHVSFKKGVRGCDQSFEQCDKCNDRSGTTNYGFQQVINVLLWEEAQKTMNNVTHLSKNTEQDTKHSSSRTYSFQPEAVQV